MKGMKSMIRPELAVTYNRYMEAILCAGLPWEDGDGTGCLEQHSMRCLWIGVEIEFGGTRRIAHALIVSAHNVHILNVLPELLPVHGVAQRQISQRPYHDECDLFWLRLAQFAYRHHRMLRLHKAGHVLQAVIPEAVAEAIIAMEISLIGHYIPNVQRFDSAQIDGNLVMRATIIICTINYHFRQLTSSLAHALRMRCILRAAFSRVVLPQPVVVTARSFSCPHFSACSSNSRAQASSLPPSQSSMASL